MKLAMMFIAAGFNKARLSIARPDLKPVISAVMVQ